MENTTLPITDVQNKKDIIQSTPIPDWFPDQLIEKISEYDESNRDGIVKRIGKTLESGLDKIAVEFNQPIFERSSKLRTEKERDQLLSSISINRETLREYVRTSPHINYQAQPEESAVINERTKKELICQMWNVTSKAWEIDRPRREKERASHDDGLPHSVNRRIGSLDRFFDRVGNLKRELLGVKNINKMAESILAIQPGVEDILREYSVK